jgi:30S ribosomal protein S31
MVVKSAVVGTSVKKAVQEEGMGKGDRRTRRGKIFSASYGNSRAHKGEGQSYQKTPGKETPKAAAVKASPAPKKTTTKKPKATS